MSGHDDRDSAIAVVVALATLFLLMLLNSYAHHRMEERLDALEAREAPDAD